MFEDAPLDLAGLRRHNADRLRADLQARGLDAAWLLGPGHLRWLVGTAGLPADGGRATWLRSALLLTADGEHPHLFTPTPECAPPELPASCVHPPLELETERGVASAWTALCDRLGRTPRALAVDEGSATLWLHLESQLETLEDAAALVAAHKVVKSAEEIECIRRAQAINERAMQDVRSLLRPGLRQSDLSAAFFARIYELGASANGIDPIWQVMAPRVADGPWTTHGGVAFPTCTTDRILREGDVLWVDTGIDVHGYQSDYGRTFVVGRAPDGRQRAQERRWLEVTNAVIDAIRPGATGRDLTRVAREAAGGETPWLPHFYLAHGVGTEAAEAPLVGTDLGEDFDASLVLAPGMVLVLEPVVWEDGYAGYRAEDVVVVTEHGTRRLSEPVS